MHFYCSSGGNAGMGCVCAATSLGFPSTIVVPMSTKPHVIAQLKTAGASEVIQTGESWFYADRHLRETLLPEVKSKGINGVYVSPFEDEAIYEGNSRIVDEVKRQLEAYRPHPEAGKEAPDAVIASIGGGGLFTGLQYGIDRHGWSDKTTLIAMGTTGAAALNTSLEKGEIVTLPGIFSIATSLGAVRIGQRTWEMATQRNNVKTVVLEDADAAMGSWRFADDERILVEPACGVSLAPCYKEGMLKELLGEKFGKESRVVVVVCGGSGMTSATIEEYRRTYGNRADKGTQDENVPSTHTGPK